MMIKKQVLGTAQFGLDYYGVSNFLRKKNLKQIMFILDTAYRNGLKYFDTAPAYNSEKLIGKFVEKRKLYNKINIITKIPKLKKNKDFLKQVVYCLKQSQKNLKVKKLFCVLMHNQDDYKIVKNNINKINYLKKRFNIKNFGFSVYDYAKAKKILKILPNAALQFPYNIINENFRKLNKKKNLFLARSIFCQGLLSGKKIKFINKNLNCSHEKYLKFLKTNNINPVDLCLDHAYSNNKIDYIIYGIQNIKELNQIIRYKKQKLNISIVKKIKTFFKSTNVDPRSWI